MAQDILTVMPTATARAGQIMPGRSAERAGSGILLTGLIRFILPSGRAHSSLILLTSAAPLTLVGVQAGVQDGADGTIPGILSSDRMLTAGEVIPTTEDSTAFILHGDIRPGGMTITAGTASGTLTTDTRLYL